MQCPYCKGEMVEGVINKGRYALKWVPKSNDIGTFNFTPFVKGIKLTPLFERSIDVYYCEPCKKMIMDVPEIY